VLDKEEQEDINVLLVSCSNTM